MLIISLEIMETLDERETHTKKQSNKQTNKGREEQEETEAAVKW